MSTALSASTSVTIPVHKRNLWNLAYQELPQADKDCFNVTSNADPKSVLDAVQECQKKVDGDQHSTKTKLRVHLIKTAKWINKFIEVGDAAVQFDPTHAALPWAAVRLILKVSISHISRYEAVSEGIATITNLVVQYDLIEQLQVDHNPDSATKISAVLTALYKSILTYLAEVMRYSDEGRGKRFLKSFSSFSDEFTAILGEIASRQKDVDYWVNVYATINLKETLSLQSQKYFDLLQSALNSLDRPLDEIGTGVKQLTDSLHEAEREKILNWVSDQPYFEHHKRIFGQVISGTGLWLLQDSHFRQWQVSDNSSVLWLHGIPGSGKSCLTSVVIEFLTRQLKTKDEPQLYYFYCARNSAEPARAEPARILSSLVRQMCYNPEKGEILPPVIEQYQKIKKQGFSNIPTANLEESIEMFVAMTTSRKSVTIVIDALDECNTHTRQDLLDALQGIIKRSTAPVKCFISSRDDQDISLNLKDCPNINIKASHNSMDIDRFIDCEVEKRIKKKHLLLGKPPPQLVSDIKDALRQRADGMFRWVELQMQFLCTLRSKHDIRDRLSKSPGSLRDIYRDLYQKFVDQEQGEVARRTSELIFRWILCVQESCKTELLLSALSQSIDGEDFTIETILQATFNFVVHDKELDVFRFAHLSVREFLEGHERYRPSVNHAAAAQACLSVLQSLDDYSQDPFADYAVWYWAYHTEKSDCERLHGDLKQSLWKFLECKNLFNFSTWFTYVETTLKQIKHWDYSEMQHRAQSMICETPHIELVACVWGFVEVFEIVLENPSRLPPSQMQNSKGEPLLHIACFYGYEVIAEYLIKQGVDVDGQGGEYGNALQAASYAGHEKVVEMLISNGANINLQGGEYGNALQAAAYKGHVRIIEILLSKDADVNALGGAYGTALQAASAGGHRKCVEILLGKGALINAMSGCYGCALQAASIGGYYDIVELLLSSGAEVNIYGRRYHGALQAASLNGHEKIAELLLRSGADVNAEGGGDGYALHVAARCGHEKVVDLLLKNGADINALGGYCGMALCAAAEGDHDTIAAVFLSAGADVHAASENGAAALHFASAAGEKDALKLLLEHKADINARTKDGSTPLHLAVNDGHQAIVAYLLLQGADVELTDDKGQTALHIASCRGETTIVEYLVDGKSNIEAAANNGFTPLLLACREGHLDIVDYLVQKGANTTVATKTGCQALHLAAQSGHLTVVKYLVQDNSHIDARDNSGFTALHFACRGGHLDVLDHLVQQGANIFAATEYGYTLLYLAAYNGYLEIVKYLVQHNLDIEMVDKNGNNALHKAVSNGHQMIVEYLLQEGAALDTTTHRGYTALHLAASNGRKDLTHFLVQQGIDVDAVTECGSTSLHLAAGNGRQNIVELLIQIGANIEAVTKAGSTSLHITAEKGHQIISGLLIEKGVNVNAVNAYGESALHLAARSGHQGIVDSLIRNGGQMAREDNYGRSVTQAAVRGGLLEWLEAQFHEVGEEQYLRHDWQGLSILHHAALSDSPEMVDWALTHETNPDIRDKQQWTPLHWAAYFGNTCSIETLLDAAAHDLLTDSQGRTPYGVAYLQGHYHLAGLLSDEGVAKDQPKLEHPRAFCDVCGQDIYESHNHCTVCPYYDLCFRCFMDVDCIHPPHAFQNHFRYPRKVR